MPFGLSNVGSKFLSSHRNVPGGSTVCYSVVLS